MSRQTFVDKNTSAGILHMLRNLAEKLHKTYPLVTYSQVIMDFERPHPIGDDFLWAISCTFSVYRDVPDVVVGILDSGSPEKKPDPEYDRADKLWAYLSGMPTVREYLHQMLSDLVQATSRMQETLDNDPSIQFLKELSLGDKSCR